MADTKTSGGSALYTHADGSQERAIIVKEHTAGEGGGVTIFLPSLKRERQTTRDRLVFNSPSPNGVTTWSCPVCTLTNDQASSTCAACNTSFVDNQGSSSSIPSSGTGASNGICQSAHIKKMPDDNSCLFHCISFLLTEVRFCDTHENILFFSPFTCW